jgi:hypothetical protein
MRNVVGDEVVMEKVQCSGPGAGIEVGEQPCVLAGLEGQCVVWVGAEVDRALDAHEFDVRETGMLEESVDPLGIGERERARPLRRRERGLATWGERVEDPVQKLVPAERLPDEQDQPPTGSERAADVRERSEGVAEEHRPEMADGDIDAGRGERMNLSVGLGEGDVADLLVGGESAGATSSRRAERSTP